jgi:hypothetical protein
MKRPGRKSKGKATIMVKKLSLQLAAVAVLAFAVPSAASATAVTFPAGTLLKPGSELEATGTDVILTSSTLGSITCGQLNLDVTITENNGTVVKGSGSAQKPTQGGCEDEGEPVTVTLVTLKEIFSNTSEKGTASFEATVDIGNPVTVTCKVVGTAVPFTFVTGGDKIVFTKAGNVTAAGCGTVKLDGTFTMETAGNAVILD